MMRRLVLAILAAVILTAPTMVLGEAPARPRELTPAQFDRLSDLESQPQHAAIVDIHATYRSEREKRLDAQRTADDVVAAAWQGGVPIGLIIMLICAAPL